MKALTGFLVVLVLLAGGLVVADRAAERYASDLIAQQLTTDLRLSRAPTVNVAGVPFLTQWASGDYQEVDITIPTVTAASVTVDDVRVTLRNLRAGGFLTQQSGFASAGVGSVNLSGLVPFSALPLPPGFTASAAGSRLKVSGSVSILGVSVPVSATEMISLQGTTVTFTPTDIQAEAAGLQLNVSRYVASRLGVSVDVSGLPFGVRVTGIAVNPTGLLVTAEAQNVSLSGA